MSQTPITLRAFNKSSSVKDKQDSSIPIFRGDLEQLNRTKLKAAPEVTSEDAPMVLRSLGSFEEFFWLIDQNRPIHFALAAQIQGPTTVLGWRDALDLVQRRHPLLSVCIKMGENSRPCFRREIAAPIPLRVLQGNNAAQRWALEMELELSIPFDAAQAPLMRAVLLHEANQAVIILVAHHSIADGRSIVFLVRDVLEALSGNVLDSLPLLASHEELLGLNGSVAALPAGPKKEESSPVTLSTRPASYVKKESLRPHIKGLRLAPALTSKLRNRARQERTTVHGALSAAMALAAWENYPEFRDAPIRICSPIDTRKLLGLGEDCAVLIDAGVVTLESQMPSDFWDIARESIANLAGAQTMEGVIASRTFLYQAIKSDIDVLKAAAICAQGFAHEMMLTNLGQLPYGTEFGQLRLEAVWGPAVSARFAGAPTIGVATTNGALCLLETHFSEPGSLLETAEQILMSACAVHSPSQLVNSI